jgi:hypothetical protein
MTARHDIECLIDEEAVAAEIAALGADGATAGIRAPPSWRC